MHRIIGLLLVFFTLVISFNAYCYCINKRLLLYNRDTNSVEIYQISYPEIAINSSDLIWQSPIIQGGSEIKPIYYKGNKAILATTDYGVIIYAYPEKTILFHREISGYKGMSIHSAIPTKDGNVIFADSAGFIGILYPGNNINDIEQPSNQTEWYPLQYAHGLIDDENHQVIYAGGYTTINQYRYQGEGHTAWLQLSNSYNINNYYLRCANYNICNENAEWEDGIHDIYPVDGNDYLFFLTTGERTFLLNTYNKNMITQLDKYSPLYEINSYYSQQENANSERDKIILQKGGIKSISGSIEENNYCVIAHPAPFFTKELQYNYYSPIILYAEQKADIVDYDLTTYHHLQFDPHLKISFYKARLLPDNF